MHAIVTHPGPELPLEVLQAKTILGWWDMYSAGSFSFIKNRGLTLCFLDFPAALCVFVYESVFAVTMPDRLWLNPSVLRYEQYHILQF